MAFGIYVHIPYCVTKCPYCDFNSYGVGGSFPEDNYVDSLLRELSFYRDRIAGERASSVFFGGGTPSLFSPGSIERIMDEISSVTSIGQDAEITLEVNPKTADLAKLKGFKAAGVNRISVGIQSFSERKLSFLGRINSPGDGENIVGSIKNAGFESFNLDIMYGTRDETLAELEADLERAADLGPGHISAYCLTVEDGTAFGKLHKRGMLRLPGDEKLTRFIEFATEYLGERGYARYEISNYALPGLECRHNLLYWRGESYLGIGAGAHSHFSLAQDESWGVRWGNIRNPSVYMKRTGEGRKPVDFTETLKREESLEDYLLMGLRLSDGLSLHEIDSRYGVSLEETVFDDLLEGGFVSLNGGRLALTPRGTLVSNEIIYRIAGRLTRDF